MGVYVGAWVRYGDSVKGCCTAFAGGTGLVGTAAVISLLLVAAAEGGTLGATAVAASWDDLARPRSS